MFFSRARNFDQRLAAPATSEPARPTSALPPAARASPALPDAPSSPSNADTTDAIEMRQLVEDLRFQLGAAKAREEQNAIIYGEELQNLKNIVMDRPDLSPSTSFARIDDEESEGYFKGKQVAVVRESEEAGEESGVMKGTLVCEMRLVDEALRTLTMTIPLGLATAYAVLGVDAEGGDGEVITYYESLINSYPASESRYRGALYLIAHDRKTDVFRPYLADMVTKEIRTYLAMIAKHAPLPPGFASLLDSEAQKDKLRSTQLEKEMTQMKLDHEAELEHVSGKSEIALLKGEMEKRASELVGMRKKLDMLSKQAAENTGLKAQIASLEHSLERTTVTKASILLKDLDKMKEEKEELRVEFSEMGEAYRLLSTEKEELEEQIKTHSAEMDNLHILLSKTKTSERELKVAIEAKNAEIDELESTSPSSSSVKEITTLKKELAQAKKKTEEAIKSKNEELARINTTTGRKLQESLDDYTKMQKVAADTIAETKQAKQDIEAGFVEQNRLASDLDAAKKDNKELKRTIKENERTIKENASKESKSPKETALVPAANKINVEMEKELAETKNKLEVAVRKLAATPPASAAPGMSASTAEATLAHMKTVVARLAKSVTALNQELAAKSNENADLMMRIVNGDGGN